MTNITVPVDSKLYDFVERSIAAGKYANKADLMRAALIQLRESDMFDALSDSLADKRAGRVYKGDLKTLVEKCDL
jgi:Arc/MetJ-type ribon-helix-helix transcriptional regulator